MNTGQMMITIGAIFLLTLVILRVSTNLLVTSDVLNRSKIDLLAISYATTMIEEASGKAYDARTANGSVSSPIQLSAVLGPEPGEFYPLYNDFDDFNAFRDTAKIDTVFISDTNFVAFQTYCAVDYVNDSNPDVATISRTWFKRLTVKVTSPAMLNENTLKQDTVTMKTIFSYWYFK